MGQLAMRAVDLCVLVEDGDDLIQLLLEQAVHGMPAGRPVLKAAGVAAALPTPRPLRLDLQIRAGAAVLPTGRDADNADSAPSLATCLSFITVERSTPARSAAWLIVLSPRNRPIQISYFCDGDRNRLRRRPVPLALRSSSGGMSWLLFVKPQTLPDAV